MADMIIHREEAHKALLDIFASVTGLPIGLYEKRGREIKRLFSKRSLENFEPYCQYIHRLPKGKELCEQDQCRRAHVSFNSAEEGLTLCHAGLYNQVARIKVGNEIRAVLFYGEMQIEGDQYRRNSLEKHREAVKALGLNELQAAELRDLLVSAKIYTPEQLETLTATLPRLEQWFYRLIDEEDRLKRRVERVTHELQTRLQAVIAEAENMAMEVGSLDSREVETRANDVLFSALAMDTVVQGLGGYLEEYRFQPRSIVPLIYEAKRLYAAEARRRGVEIRIRIHRAQSELEISSHHLQHALNNLVHNAVKYSFRGGDGRERYVLISGRPGENYYTLSIENYGVGILPEEIESGRIFQDGYQGKLTAGEYRTGAGKGLYFVKRVIDRHHGRIRVTSELMSDHTVQGGQPHLTRFIISLPYKQPEGDL